LQNVTHLHFNATTCLEMLEEIIHSLDNSSFVYSIQSPLANFSEYIGNILQKVIEH
jgi:hypothetical protein